MTQILHIAYRADWARAVAGAGYPMSSRGITVADEGYVHCSWPHQLAGVLSRIYKDVDPDLLTVIVLDTHLIEADGVVVKNEDTHGAGENYPHIYGELQPRWAVRTEPIPT